MTIVGKILLLLLKIVGILFLTVLSLLLVSILLVLFVPARYRGDIRKTEEKEHFLSVVTRIHWLNPVLRIKLQAGDGEKLTYSVRILGYLLMGSDKKQKPRKEKKKKDKVPKVGRYHRSNTEGTKEQKQSDDDTRNPGYKEMLRESVGDTEDGSLGEQQGEGDLGEATEQGDTKEENTENDGNKENVFQKLLHIPGKIVRFFEKLWKAIQGLFEKKDLVVAFLEDEVCKAAFSVGRSDVKRVLMHIRPRKLKGSVVFGTGNPESTGKLLAVAAIFFPLYGNNVTIEPDFCEKRFAAELHFRGRVRLGTVIRILWHFYRNKDSKQMRKSFKKLKSDLGRKAA